jgi:DNA primase
MIAPEIIQKVRDATDIVALVGKHVALKRAGNSWKGLCPFHQERTPSFNVVPSKQIFHCFGCGEGGDVFSFLVKKEKLSFTEAVKQLAFEAGIEVEEKARDERAEREAKEREELVRILEMAADWFRRNFKDSTEAETARAYAAKRGLSDETLERFAIGYAPQDGGALERAALKKGVTREQLIKTGLVQQNERGAYCRFRGRLMFPILDPRARVVGFGARILGEGEPKYLNSPETSLFSKGRLLYAMPQAKDAMLKKKRALLTEGYMDAIACQQAGVHEAVAVLGTALTEEHAKQLKRYVDELLLVFDADQAGLRAALKGCEVALQAGMEPKVVRLGEHKDPDEYLKAKGLAAFEEELGRPIDAVAFFSDALLGLASGKERRELSLKEKAGVMKQLFPLLSRYATAMEAEVQLARAAERLGLPLEAVKEDFSAYQADPKKNEPALRAGSEAEALSNPKGESLGAAPAKPAHPALERCEREILALLVGYPEFVAEAKAELPEPDFATEDLANAAHWLWKSEGKPLMAWESDGSEGYRQAESLLSRLAMEDASKFQAPQEHLHKLLEARQEILLGAEIDRLQLRIRQASGDEAIALLAELKEKTRARNDIRSLRNT